jgi:hypothetical protein
LFKFIIESYSFKKILIITAVFIGTTYLCSRLFDIAWGSRSSIPIINLEDVYKAPLWYDNFSRVNFTMLSKEKLCIEGNKRFKLKDSPKNYDYYDTVFVKYPETDFEYSNNIFLQFEDNPGLDSIRFVVSKSDDPKIFYKQIFNSTVIVNDLNKLSEKPEEFRIKKENLVSDSLLNNNDALIEAAFKYFNDNKDTLGLAECGTNSEIFRNICFKFNLPCRVIGLQGGDADQAGYYNFIGYPLHVVCEIYSSKHKKWYVVDPSFGFRFRQNNIPDYFNAVELSRKYIFNREKEVIADSILYTKRNVVGRDYYKFYENVYYKLGMEYSTLRKLLKAFYPEFNYHTYHYSNNYPPVKNGFYYIGVKTFMYFFLLILYINSIMFLFIKRLVSVKKPKKNSV